MRHQYFPLPPYNPPTEFFCCMSGAFSAEQIEKIIDQVEQQQFQARTHGGVGEQRGTIGDNHIDEAIRKSDVTFVGLNPDTEWIFHHIGGIVGRANYDKFGLDLDFIEAVQFTKYSGDGGHYAWHIDTHQGDMRTQHRKLSCSVMLTEPDEYEGGDLLINNGGNPATPMSVRARKGDAVFFYSHLPHMVTPVTKGERLSLVAWILGPKIR